MDFSALDLLRQTYCVEPNDATRPFVEHFRRAMGEHLAAVIFYGSKLDESLATSTSFFDFYLICDDYDSVFSRRRDRWLARVLPPNIYYLELPPAVCKYCVISLTDLRESVGPQARDFYHLGRFSKRLALLWSRDAGDRDDVLGCCYQAMQSIAPHAINKVGNEFTLDEFIRRALALSYEGEVRLEQTGDKVDALFASAAEFYRAIWRHLLAEFADHHRELFHDRQPTDPPDTYFLRRTASARAGQYADTAHLLAASRRRARARWPKNIILVDNWLDILLAKVERTYGVKIEMTPTERRWALILGWKHYFRLRREGKIH